MPKLTVLASAAALPKSSRPAADQTPATIDELALAFVIACRLAGHRPHIDRSGRFGITLNVTAPTRTADHHLGPDHAYTLGFDDRPFAALFGHPDYVAKLIVAMKEMEAAI